MQEMFAVWKAWMEKFKAEVVDMGSKLKPSGKVLTASGVMDGPPVETKEIVGGYMIVTADSYDAASVGALRRDGAAASDHQP